MPRTRRSQHVRVGFPGETERDFPSCSNSCVRLNWTGSVASSTPRCQGQANELPDPVDPQLAEERLQALMEMQAEVSKDRLGSQVGSQVEVVIDDVEADAAIARSYAESLKSTASFRFPELGIYRPVSASMSDYPL